jgi:hypothetical protein
MKQYQHFYYKPNDEFLWSFFHSLTQVDRYTASMQDGHIMMTMGSDFQYYNALMAYKNLDKLIYHVNKIHGEKVHLMYSTPACYTKARNVQQKKWTVKTDDFMPYSNGPGGQYWSGYFTSRPGFKGYVWDTNPVLQMCHHMNVRNHEHGNNHSLGFVSLSQNLVIINFWVLIFQASFHENGFL